MSNPKRFTPRWLSLSSAILFSRIVSSYEDRIAEDKINGDKNYILDLCKGSMTHMKKRSQLRIHKCALLSRTEKLLVVRRGSKVTFASNPAGRPRRHFAGYSSSHGMSIARNTAYRLDRCSATIKSPPSQPHLFDVLIWEETSCSWHWCDVNYNNKHFDLLKPGKAWPVLLQSRTTADWYTWVS